MDSLRNAVQTMTRIKSNNDICLCRNFFCRYLDVCDVDKLTRVKLSLVVMWNCTTLTTTTGTTFCNSFLEAVERCILLLAVSLTDRLMFRMINVMI